MKNIKLSDEIKPLFQSQVIIKGKNNELYVTMSSTELPDTIATLCANNFELVSLFCAQNFDGYLGFTLFYIFEKSGIEEVLGIKVPLVGGKASSIAKAYPSACWYEREITDGFGIQFEGAFDTRPLFLHETYPEGFHPLLKSFKNDKIKTQTPRDEYQSQCACPSK